MDDNRKSLYYLENADNIASIEKEIAHIKGVTFVKTDKDNLTLQYEIDEWTSDYDVFTEVMRVISEHGNAIDFERESKNEDDNKETKSQTTEDVSVEPEIEEEVQEEKKDKKQKKTINENLSRFIELCVAVVCFIVSMIIKKHDTIDFIFLAIAFAVAGYDALYESYVKITKKIILSDEMIITLASFCCLLLGRIEFAVATMVIYSIVNYARKVIREKMQSNSVCWNNPENLSISTENGVTEKKFEDVEIGDVVCLLKNERVTLDGNLQDESVEVVSIDGSVRQVNCGESIYAGETTLNDVKISVTKKCEDCKYYSFNSYVKRASESQTKFASFAKKKEQLYNIVVLSVCLVIAFIIPIFSSSYKTGLLRWGYSAVIIASISGLSYYVFAHFVNINSAIKAGRKSGAIIGGILNAEKIASSKGLYIDEKVLNDENGNLQEDSHGAIHELKDSNIHDITIAGTFDDEKANDLCIDLKVASYLARENKQDELSQLKNAKNEGNLIALSADDLSEEFLEEEVENKEEKIKNKAKNGAVIAFNCGKDSFKGNGAVVHNKVCYLPYIIKLAKRTSRINKLAIILGVSVKVVLCALSLFGIAELWWAFLADSVVSVITGIISFFNGSEVY